MRNLLVIALLLFVTIVPQTFSPVKAQEPEEIPIHQIICFPQDGLLYCQDLETGELFTMLDPDWVPPPFPFPNG